MEYKRRLVLKHHSGLYWSNTAEHTKILFNAKRFGDEGTARLWMDTSIYAPDKQDEYTLIPIVQTIEEEQEDVQEE